MKVGELREMLSRIPDDFEVLIASDEEMNTVHEMQDDVVIGMWDGDEFISEEDWEDMFEEDDDSDYPGDDAIVLIP